MQRSNIDNTHREILIHITSIGTLFTQRKITCNKLNSLCFCLNSVQFN